MFTSKQESTMIANSSVSKNYKISKLQEAIDYAKQLLKVEGMEEDYYAWHRKTICIDEASIASLRENV
jgi:hypothetical protein